MASPEIDAVIPAALPAGEETSLHNEHSASLAFLVLGALGVAVFVRAPAPVGVAMVGAAGE